MQQSLAMGSGQGNNGSPGFQLPDIIQSQGELKQQLGKAGKEGQEGSEGQEAGRKGQNGQEGDGEGDNGRNGTKSGEGGNEDGRQQGGSTGNGNSDGGQGMGEQELSEMYEIYKEQQRIREALEEQLKDMMEEKDQQLARKLLRQMEEFENDLLRNGITNRSYDRVNRIEHELMKLENAALKQGEKKERESQANDREYSNPLLTRPRNLDNYRNEIEILNRQSLPLQQIYQNKVKEYFRKDD
jgi:hypothetical protein